MTDFYYARGARLSPREAVLFMFNHTNDLGVNISEVDISNPLGYDAWGRTMVDIKGKGLSSPNGDGGYVGTARFAYMRVPLNLIDLPVDGSFFDTIGSKPSFLGIVEELTRRTQYGCTIEDFVQSEYSSDINGGYVLKAHPDSLRFEGEVNIGHPRRANFDEFVPVTIGELSFEEHNGVFDLKVDRLPVNFDITEYPSIISKLVSGYQVKLQDIVLFNTLLVQGAYSGLTIVNSVTPNSFLNINGMRVIYHGPLRQSSDDKHLFISRDRVIELVLDPAFAPRAFGNMKLYYSSAAVVTPIMASEKIYALNMFSTGLSGSTKAAFWQQCVTGTVLDDNGGAGDVSVAFETAFGLTYDLLLRRALRVTYNGPARPTDMVPEGALTIRVCELTPVDNLLTQVYGPAKVYY